MEVKEPWLGMCSVSGVGWVIITQLGGSKNVGTTGGVPGGGGAPETPTSSSSISSPSSGEATGVSSSPLGPHSSTTKDGKTP